MRIGVVQSHERAARHDQSLRAGLTRLQDAKRQPASTWSCFPSCSWAATTSTRPWWSAPPRRGPRWPACRRRSTRSGLLRGRRARPARRRALRRGRHPAPRAGRPAATPRRTCSAPRKSSSLRARGSGRARSPAGRAACSSATRSRFPRSRAPSPSAGARLLIVTAAFGKPAPAHLADRHHLARPRERLLPRGRRPRRRERTDPSSPATAGSSTRPASCSPTPASAPRC